MNYSAIKYNDVANGIGLRVSLFVSGCTNHCPGCFNTETWDFNYGKPFDETTKQEILENLKLPRYRGLTILGGEPFELQNQESVLDMIKSVKNMDVTRDIWLYTGFTYDKDLAPGGKRYIPDITDEILSLSDVLVDGRFVLALKNISLRFRGSSNQRVIDLKQSSYDNIIPLYKER